jgi:hypothetical protein
MSRRSNYDCSGRWSIPFDGMGDYIPANPPIYQPSAFHREPQALTGMQEQNSRPSVTYDKTTGVLAFTLYSNALDEGEIKHLLADYRARPAGVKTFTILINSARIGEYVRWLDTRGFSRDVSHPLAQGALTAWTKSYSNEAEKPEKKPDKAENPTPPAASEIYMSRHERALLPSFDSIFERPRKR